MNKKKIVSSVIVIIITFAIIMWKNLDYNYEPQGESFTAEASSYMGASGYTIQGNQYSVSGEDPQFYVNGITDVIGGVAVTLTAPVSQEEGLPVQVFYIQEGESYAEKNSSKTVMAKGETVCVLPLPVNNYRSFRFDIDGDFTLQAITFYRDETIITPVISNNTIRNCLMYFPVAVIAVWLIVWAHGVRAKGMGTVEYAASVLFGTGSRGTRQAQWDYMRVLAAVLVILAHACSPMVDLADADWKRFLLVCGLSLGLSCNVIYVMLSGALLLSSHREESVGSFYIRRASKVIIPLIAYYLLLLSLNDEVSFLPPENVGSAFKRILSGAPDVGPHLWLIYTIVALYLVTPFFRVMVQHLSDKMLFALAIVILLCNALTLYLPLAGISFGISTFLAGWEGVFLLGYIMTKEEIRKHDRKIIIAGVISFIAAVVVVYLNSAHMNYVYHNAVTLVLLSCGIFALVLKHKSWFEGKDNRLLRLCSRYSYAMILIHWYALFVVVQGRFHVTALRFGCIGGIAMTVVLTFLVSLALGIVYDNTVVIVFSVLFDKAVNIFQSKSGDKRR